MDTATRKRTAYRVSMVSIIANIFLSVIKIVAGFLGSSSVLISDGIHSVSDVFSTFLVIFGIGLSSREADESHKYGHERIESVIGIYLSAFLGLVGLGIGYRGIMNLINGSITAAPSRITLYVAVISILMKEAMYQVTYRAGKKISSSSMIADAWHHRSDALSSIGSFIGIFFAMRGYYFMDPLLSVIVSVFILKAAVEIAMDSIRRLIDTALNPEEEEEMKKAVLETDGVKDVLEIKTRIFADSKYVDLVITVDGTLSVEQGHDIATQVHDMVEERFAPVKHCMVHVEPE